MGIRKLIPLMLFLLFEFNISYSYNLYMTNGEFVIPEIEYSHAEAVTKYTPALKITFPDSVTILQVDTLAYIIQLRDKWMVFCQKNTSQDSLYDEYLSEDVTLGKMYDKAYISRAIEDWRQTMGLESDSDCKLFIDQFNKYINGLDSKSDCSLGFVIDKFGFQLIVFGDLPPDDDVLCWSKEKFVISDINIDLIDVLKLINSINRSDKLSHKIQLEYRNYNEPNSY